MRGCGNAYLSRFHRIGSVALCTVPSEGALQQVQLGTKHRDFRAQVRFERIAEDERLGEER